MERIASSAVGALSDADLAALTALGLPLAGRSAPDVTRDVATLRHPRPVPRLAGAFFLHEIDGWRSGLIEVHRGPTATVCVPSPTVFVLSKLERLSESDLDDCRAMIRWARAIGAALDLARLRAAIGDRLATSAERARRVAALLAALDA